MTGAEAVRRRVVCCYFKTSLFTPDSATPARFPNPMKRLKPVAARRLLYWPAEANMYRPFFRAALLMPLLFSTGCGVNQYASPRTTPDGQSVHSVAINALFSPEKRGFGEPWPVLEYQARYGVGSRVDLGFRLGASFGVDLKWNFLRSRYVDLAIDPSLNANVVDDGVYTDISVLSAALPLSAGFNLASSTSLYVHMAPYLRRTERRQDNLCWEPICYEPKMDVSVQGGVGLQLRVKSFFAIHPEASLTRVNGDLVGQVGIGFSFGALPVYEVNE